MDLEASIARNARNARKIVPPKTAWRTQAELMNTQAAELDADSVSWYGGATKVFLAGTPNGTMIRGTIPTTTATNHAATPPPAPAPSTPAH